MNNNLKGNQKHLTLSQRIEIEKGLLASKSFASIAKEIGKDPSTISKEVRKNAKISERKNMDFAPIPCVLRKKCQLMYLCDSECGTQCKICKKVNLKCINVCPSYQPVQCEKLQKPPYICNGCGKRINCLMEKRIYSSKHAYDSYRELLVSRREGINQTPERIQKINDILTPLIKNGQSIAHIYANHAEELGCSRRTIYSYIDSGIFEVRNIDMRRCNVYFCDPYSSWQKGMIEKNHEYIRYVLPKGTSFDELTPEKTTLLMNHINSETRDSLNSHTPFELSQFLLDKKLHDCLGLKVIKPDEVKLIPALLK